MAKRIWSRRYSVNSGGTRVLDAGCGTGRVAIELAARGFSVVGVDADSGMLSTARAKAPGLEWIEADLSDLTPRLDAEFDLVLLAGNVMIFLQPGSEGRVMNELSACRAPGSTPRGRLRNPAGSPGAREIRPAGRGGRARVGGAMGHLGPQAFHRRRLRGVGSPTATSARHVKGRSAA